jgi:hsp70-interacting protein
VTAFPSDADSRIVSHPSTSSLDDSYYTNGQTSEAIKSNDILRELVTSVTSPTPSGPNGDDDTGDPDYQEKAVRALLTYAENNKINTWDGVQDEFKELIALGENEEKSSGSPPWGLTVEEWSKLKGLS